MLCPVKQTKLIKHKSHKILLPTCDDLKNLTLKAPITTAADDKFCEIFPNFQKKGMIFHENCLPADNSHEISCFICYF